MDEYVFFDSKVDFKKTSGILDYLSHAVEFIKPYNSAFSYGRMGVMLLSMSRALMNNSDGIISYQDFLPIYRM